jgi:transcriptional regulator GlxA family with amidase domain
MPLSGVFRSGAVEAVRLTFLLIPEFSMIAFTSTLEPLRLANLESGRVLYRWDIVSANGQPVAASNGIRVAVDGALGDETGRDNIVLCSGINGHAFKDAALFASLRKASRGGAHLGAVCTGAHILARAGLLDGYRCTIHWANLDSLVEEFPELDVRAELYEVDRDRFTCAGGVAAVDMVLRDIAYRHGAELAAAVSDQFMHERIRDGADDQRVPLQTRLRISHPRLVRAIAEMERNTEHALDRDEIATRVGLSRRQLERLFRRFLNTSPARYYLKLRLNRARQLLTQTAMPVTEVAFASGFTSASHFSKCYRDTFTLTPREERRRALAGQEGSQPLDMGRAARLHADGETAV